MLTESLPIEIFINARIESPRIAKVINNWKIETRSIELVLIAHFKEMGIYTVTPTTEYRMIDTIIGLLQNSPDLFAMVKKAEAAEMARKQSRHADT